MKPERWIVKTGGGALLSRAQIPLRLAWAFSIHKSQVGHLLELKFYSGEDSLYHHLGCDIMWSGRWVPAFCRNLLPDPLGWYVPLNSSAHL